MLTRNGRHVMTCLFIHISTKPSSVFQCLPKFDSILLTGLRLMQKKHRLHIRKPHAFVAKGEDRKPRETR